VICITSGRKLRHNRIAEGSGLKIRTSVSVVRSLCAVLFLLLPARAVFGQAHLPDSPSHSRFVAINHAATLGFPAYLAWPRVPNEASDPGQESKSPLRRGLQDQKEIYTLPLRRNNLKWTALFLGGTAGLIAADKHISGAIGEDHSDISRVISDVGLYSMIGSVGVLGVSGWKTGDPHQREAAILSAEALGNSGVAVIATQLIAGRQRPLEGNREGDFWKNNSVGSSFPSGHSSFSWALASVIAHEYPTSWVEFLTYGTATTVSITRVTGLRHFPADVAVGAVFGYFIGQHIFRSHCRSGVSPGCHGRKSPST
jgi:hypothetical protein